jgi:ribulose-5-phosphate 4-epimerase/fuculose-1-phosphate aldolase
MTVMTKISESSIRDQVSAEEWEARVQLAACYRLVAKFGMTDLIYNHITVRAPGTEDQFLINAFGMNYSEVTASSLYKIDLDGNVILKPDNDFGINRAGFVIHSAVHAVRHDAACVIHTHTAAGISVASMKEGLLPISQNALRFMDRIGYHEYEGPATDLDERARLAENLGDKDGLFLRNHGLLVVGPTIGAAFHLTQRLETACQIQCKLMSTGAEIVYPSEAVMKRSSALLAPQNTDNAIPNGGKLEWEACVRELDREDTGYRA